MEAKIVSFRNQKYQLKMKGVLFPSLINGLQIQGSKTLIMQLKLILLFSNHLFNLISGCRVQLWSLILERMCFLCSIAAIDIMSSVCMLTPSMPYLWPHCSQYDSFNHEKTTKPQMDDGLGTKFTPLLSHRLHESKMCSVQNRSISNKGSIQSWK